MNDDDMARLLPADRDLPAARKQILKEHLMTELRRADCQPGQPGQPGTDRTRPRRRRRQGEHRRRTVLVAGAVLTATAVAVATAVVVGTSTSPHAPKAAQAAQPAPPATAAQLLARIATAAARQPTPVVRDSDFMYIRSRVAYEIDSVSNGHETVTMEKPHERQIWLPVANICATGLLIEDGERTPISPFPVRERQGRSATRKETSRSRTSPAPARATSATPATGCCSPSPPSRTRCSPTSRPARSGPTTTRPPRSGT